MISMTHRPIISIVCATYNAEEVLLNFLESVRRQRGKSFELIIVDGNSTDSTPALIRKNQDIISKYIVERDSGIYDAWNKGIKLARGDWICFVGADDILRDNFTETYLKAINGLTDGEIEYISTKVNYVANDKTILTLGKPWKWKEYRFRMTTAHVGSLHRRELFDEIGFYNTNYSIVGDYELLLRKGRRLRTMFINEVTVDMNAEGVSLSLESLKERYIVHRSTGKMNLLIAAYYYIIGVLSLVRLKYYVK